MSGVEWRGAGVTRECNWSGTIPRMNLIVTALNANFNSVSSVVTDETELKLALSAVTIRFIRGIVPLQLHSRVTPAPRHSTPLISIIWYGANRYSVPKRSCGQKKISFRLKNIESGNVQK